MASGPQGRLLSAALGWAAGRFDNGYTPNSFYQGALGVAPGLDTSPICSFFDQMVGARA